jgi:hypothetical protein
MADILIDNVSFDWKSVGQMSWLKVNSSHPLNGTARFKECKQLFEYQHLLLLGDIWWSKF